MLNQAERDRGLSFLERGLRRVLRGNHFASLRGGGHQSLSLWRVVILESTEAAKPMKHLI